MTARFRNTLLPIGVSLVVGFIFASTFNACSDVEFAKGFAKSLGDPCGAFECGEPYPVSETFSVPAIGRKVDVVLIVDNSGSMDAEVRELGARLDGFVGVLDTKVIDWQLAYMFTDNDANFREWSNSGKILTPAEANRAMIFNTTVDQIRNQGNSDGDEQGITAARRSLNEANFFRDDAALAYVIISDEDQKSCGGLCQGQSNQYRAVNETDQPIYFLNEAKAKFGAKPITAHSIIIRPGDTACQAMQQQQAAAFYGTFYDLFSRTTAGLVGDICASSYANQLQGIGNAVESSLASVSLKCPPIPGTLSMSPSTYSHRVEGNRVIFQPALPAGATITVDYQCQSAGGGTAGN